MRRSIALGELTWAEYLSWYRHSSVSRFVTGRSWVRVEPADGFFRLHLEGKRCPTGRNYAQKLSSQMAWRHWVVHTYLQYWLTYHARCTHIPPSAIDFEALRGKTVAVLGWGRLQLSMQQGVAAESGAKAVHLFVRRSALPISTNPSDTGIPWCLLQLSPITRCSPLVSSLGACVEQAPHHHGTRLSERSPSRTFHTSPICTLEIGTGNGRTHCHSG
ncbi:hypothetical protein NSTCB13_03472 [Nostoc sp. DSM 114160]|jgi:hypothetical protein